jgi:RNA polymerase sigma-70 factor (ECF subfamily)
MIPKQNSRQQFASTHWSMARQAAAPQEGADARKALVELCLRYWYPIYAYVRHSGHSPAIAQDITRSFLQHLFQHFQQEAAVRKQGQFRKYLLDRVRSFLVEDWRRPVEGDFVAELAQSPGDLEARNARDNAGARSPEEAYQQSFALELIARAFSGLRHEARETGHIDMYDALEAFIAAEPSTEEYSDLARRLRTRPLALVVALKRLRQRFRELIDVELADTVGSAEELLAEQQALFAVLSRCM